MSTFKAGQSGNPAGRPTGSIANYEARRARAIAHVKAMLAEGRPVVPMKPPTNSRLEFDAGRVVVTAQFTKIDPLRGVVPRKQPLFKIEVEGGALFCTEEQLGFIVDAWVAFGSGGVER